jgi:DNA gyrase/topoisomerase IV subunit B
VSDGLVEKAVKQLKKDKMKYDDSKTGLSKMKTYFRQHMALLVVALLPNPRFDGQTKERLTLHPKEWGFAAAIDDKLVDRIDKKLGLVDKVLMESEARNLALLQRKSAVPTGTSARVSIAKYQGANMAGRLLHKCLIESWVEGS